MNPELEQLAQRVAGALLNGLYQGVLLALVLWLGLKVFRGTNAATRHAVGFVALLVITLLPFLHFLMPGGVHMAGEGSSSERAADQAAALVSQIDPTTAREALVSEMASPNRGEEFVPGAFEMLGQPPVATLAPPEGLIAVDAPGLSPGTPENSEATPARPDFAIVSESVPEPDSLSIGAESVESLPTTARQASFNLPPVRHWRAELPGVVSVVMLAVVGAIAVMRLLRLGWQLVVLSRLKRTATPAGFELAGKFSALQRELKITRPVRLLVDERITTPMAVGYFRPAVMLPAALASEPVESGIEGILRHELAHIQRRDDWCNLFQQLIAAIHFYHPAVAWLSHRLTMEREVACDDFALAKSASRRDYALLLAEFAGRNRGREWIAAPAAWSHRSQLKERINMILDTNRNTSRRLARISAGVLTCATLATAAVALIAGPRLVLAASAGQLTTPPPAGGAAVALVSPAGGELIAHTGEAPPAGAAIISPDQVEWKVDHAVAHAVAIEHNPDLVITARPVITGGGAVAIKARPGVVIAHGAPPQPASPKAAQPPTAPKPGHAPKAVPAPGDHPVPPSAENGSIEQRMERLERMIEKLVNDDRKFFFEPRPGEMKLKEFGWKNKSENENFSSDSSGWNFPNAPHPEWPMSGEQRKAVEESMKTAEKEMARAIKEAQRDVARVARERIERDVQLRAQLEVRKEHGRAIKDAELQRKALEGQRRSLEREMENLNRHLRQLEEQAGHLDQEMERLEAEDHEEPEEPGDDAADSRPRVKQKEVKP